MERKRNKIHSLMGSANIWLVNITLIPGIDSEQILPVGSYTRLHRKIIGAIFSNPPDFAKPLHCHSTGGVSFPSPQPGLAWNCWPGLIEPGRSVAFMTSEAKQRKETQFPPGSLSWNRCLGSLGNLHMKSLCTLKLPWCKDHVMEIKRCIQSDGAEWEEMSHPCWELLRLQIHEPKCFVFSFYIF